MKQQDQLHSRKTAEQAVMQSQGPQGDRKAAEPDTNLPTKPAQARRGLV